MVHRNWYSTVHLFKDVPVVNDSMYKLGISNPGAVYFNVVLQTVPQVKKCSYTLVNTAFLTGSQCGFPSFCTQYQYHCSVIFLVSQEMFKKTCWKASCKTEHFLFHRYTKWDHSCHVIWSVFSHWLHFVRPAGNRVKAAFNITSTAVTQSRIWANCKGLSGNASWLQQLQYSVTTVLSHL